MIGSTDYKTLERKYLFNLEEMTKEEIEEFLGLLQGNKDIEFAEKRIPILQKKLRSIENLKEANSTWELTWKSAAYEYVDITNRWLELGAIWECRETITKWSYKGNVFYTWFSGLGSKLITEEIVNTRKADELFKEMADEYGRD